MLEHVNEMLLDRMIVQDPSGRFGSVTELRRIVVEVKQLVSGGYTPIAFRCVAATVEEARINATIATSPTRSEALFLRIGSR